jgi:hypothetical protein
MEQEEQGYYAEPGREELDEDDDLELAVRKEIRRRIEVMGRLFVPWVTLPFVAPIVAYKAITLLGMMRGNEGFGLQRIITTFMAVFSVLIALVWALWLLTVTL